VIKVKGMKGRVVEITFLETKIETTKKDMIFIPNSVLIKTEIVKVQGKE
jgi:small-conductance mechanosensitive channel